MNKLLAENLLRFGAKGLSKSNMFKFLFEQDDRQTALQRIKDNAAYAQAYKLAEYKSRGAGNTLLVKQFEYVPITESPKSVKINFYNNFVTIDDGTANPDDARAQINAVIQEFKNAGANLDDPKTEITIRSGATSAVASTSPGRDGLAAGKKQIDHTYYLKGDDWKEKFTRYQSSNDQWGNEQLARQRGENVKKEMLAAGVKATITVEPETNASERFVSIEGKTLGTDKVLVLSDLPKVDTTVSMYLDLGLSKAGFDSKGSSYGVKATKYIQDFELEMSHRQQYQPNKKFTPEEKAALMSDEVKYAYWWNKHGAAYNIYGRFQYNVRLSFNHRGNTYKTGIGGLVEMKSYPKEENRFLPSAFDPRELEQMFKEWSGTANRSAEKGGRGQHSNTPWKYWTKVDVLNDAEEPVKELIQSTGHFTSKAARYVSYNLSLPLSGLIKNIIGTDLKTTLMDALPMANGKVAKTFYSNIAKTPIPKFKSPQRTRDAQQLINMSNAVASKLQPGQKTRVFEISKTVNLSQLAAAAQAGGIGGASATMQEQGAYWTDGWFLDLTVEKPMPIPITDENANEIFSGIRGLIKQ